MHRIDAEIARTRLAHDRVEIRSVAIEISPGLMHQSGNFDGIRLEQPAGVGISQHDRGDIRPEPALDLGRVKRAVRARGDCTHLESGARRRGRICAMRRLRHENDFAGLILSLRRDRGLDRHHAAGLAMRARSRRHGDGVHPGHDHQPAGELGDKFKRALHGGLRLQGMNIGKARQPRHRLVEAGIMLHRAGAKRINPGVDRIIQPRQPHIMAYRLGLAQARKAGRFLAFERAEPKFEWQGFVEIDAGILRTAYFKDKPFLDFEAAIACEGFRIRRLGSGRMWVERLSHQHDRASCKVFA